MDIFDRWFADLNQRLNQGQVFGTRSFQLKQGIANLRGVTGLALGTVVNAAAVAAAAAAAAAGGPVGGWGER